jgi:hypothetical protein
MTFQNFFAMYGCRNSKKKMPCTAVDRQKIKKIAMYGNRSTKKIRPCTAVDNNNKKIAMYGCQSTRKKRNCHVRLSIFKRRKPRVDPRPVMISLISFALNLI